MNGERWEREKRGQQEEIERKTNESRNKRAPAYEESWRGAAACTIEGPRKG